VLLEDVPPDRLAEVRVRGDDVVRPTPAAGQVVSPQHSGAHQILEVESSVHDHIIRLMVLPCVMAEPAANRIRDRERIGFSF
jgi:hypothetical protein